MICQIEQLSLVSVPSDINRSETSLFFDSLSTTTCSSITVSLFLWRKPSHSYSTYINVFITKFYCQYQIPDQRNALLKRPFVTVLVSRNVPIFYTYHTISQPMTYQILWASLKHNNLNDTYISYKSPTRHSSSSNASTPNLLSMRSMQGWLS